MGIPKRYSVMIACLLVSACLPVLAQMSLQSSAFGGGITSTDGRSLMTGTIGQTLIGPIANGISAIGQGFWYTLPEWAVADVHFEPAVAGSGIRLYQNIPNPFSTTTTIAFDLPRRGHVSLKLFDAVGHEVRTLLDEYREAGRVTVTTSAEQLESGTYSARLVADDAARTIIMVVVR